MTLADIVAVMSGPDRVRITKGSNATLQTRETIGGGMFDRGALTINEYRELMYYGPVEDGDQRLVSLNYVKVGDQSLYQVGQQNEPPDDTGANDREKRAMQAAARTYMQIMKGGQWKCHR